MKLAEVLDLFGVAPRPNGDEKARPQPAPAPPKPVKPAPPPGPRARTEAEALAVARRGGGGWQRVVFTRNRRIMASVGSGGRDLRLNEAFASAPDRVLAAASEMFAGRTARRRESAREMVRAFIQQIPPAPAAAARPRTRAAAPGDAAQIARLRAEFDRVNAESFAGALPRVPMHLSGRMKRRNGHFSARPLEIVLSRRLCTHGAPGEAEQTLRHEMIHLWQFVEGIPVDHGAAFRRMARKLDVHPRATRRVEWADADGAK